MMTNEQREYDERRERENAVIAKYLRQKIKNDTWVEIADKVAHEIVEPFLKDAIGNPCERTMKRAVAAIALHGCCLSMTAFADNDDSGREQKKMLMNRQAMMEQVINAYDELILEKAGADE